MLKPGLVPSRLVDTSARPPVRLVAAHRPSRFRITRFWYRVGLWLLWVLWMFVRGKLDQAAYARSVRQLFEDLGGLWIKVGQLLSLRVDMFSAELCQELANLQGQVVGFLPEQARGILERELGAPVERFFDEFADVPFAAASIGQVHRAHLRYEGVWVAVKIQRPYLEEIFARDLALVEWCFRFLRLFRILPFMHWEDGLREIREIMREELDCRYEASAFRRMKKSLKKHRIYVPKVFSRYTTTRVIVTEFVDAVLMADYIQMQEQDPKALEAWLKENNVNPHRVARRLLESSFRQLFEDNLYHGDMHPGNILLLRNSRVALIDFGAIAFTEREYWQRAQLFVKGLFTGDYAKAAETAFLLCGTLPNIDLEKVKEKLVENLRAWGARTVVRELPYREKSLDNAFVEVAKILFMNRFAMQWALMRLRRAAGTLDASIIALYPDIDTSKSFRGLLRGSEQRAIIRTMREGGPRLVRSFSSAMEVSENLYEQALYQTSLVRRQARVFEATTNKLGFLLAVFCRQLAVLQAVAIGVVLTVYLYQHHESWVHRWMGPQLIRVVRVFPLLDSQVWDLILLILVYLFFTSMRLSKVLAAKDRGER